MSPRKDQPKKLDESCRFTFHGGAQLVVVMPSGRPARSGDMVEISGKTYEVVGTEHYVASATKESVRSPAGPDHDGRYGVFVREIKAEGQDESVP